MPALKKGEARSAENGVDDGETAGVRGRGYEGVGSVSSHHNHQREPAGRLTASPEEARKARKEVKRLEREREREKGKEKCGSQRLGRARKLKNRFRQTISIWRVSCHTTSWSGTSWSTSISTSRAYCHESLKRSGYSRCSRLHYRRCSSVS